VDVSVKIVAMFGAVGVKGHINGRLVRGYVVSIVL
jgi:hypothetical protein